MLRVAALFAVLALVAAQELPVTLIGAEKTITISEGDLTPKKVQFKLAEPIICEDINAECRVIIRIHNSHPEDVHIDRCMLVWEKHEWHKIKSIEISSVQDYIQDFEKTITLTTEMESPASFYSAFNPKDITLRTPNANTASCSGVGDPHYRTFDGRRWHQYGTGQTIFYKSTVRDFEVQTYMFRSIARNCAVVGREGNSLAVINACGSKFQAFTRLGCPQCTDNPKISFNGGNAYTINFASGAVIRATRHGQMLQVYTTAPGADYKNTEGMCGNNNGVSGDDDNIYTDSTKTSKKFQYVVRNIPDLIDEMQIKTNLFNWHPSDYTEPPSTEEQCDAVPPKYVRPILLNPNSEDITDIIKDASDNEQDPDEVIDFDDFDVPDELPGVTDEEAEANCNVMRDTQAVRGCSSSQSPDGVLTDEEVQGFVDDCVIDFKEAGNDPSFVADAIDALTELCAQKATQLSAAWPKDQDGNPVPPEDLVNALCPGETVDGPCNGNGACVAGKCECDTGFVGSECSVDTTSPPNVEGIDSPTCDTVGEEVCPQNITLSGSNIYNGDEITCRYRQGETVIERPGVFLGLEIMCPVLTQSSHSGKSDDVWKISVSNDGVIFSDEFDFTYYDSHCRVCNEFGCEDNTHACTIGDQCILEGIKDPNNFCRICDPESNSNDYTFSYQDSVCRPQFEARSYFGNIDGDGNIGDEIAKVALRFHEGDPQASSPGDVQFSLQSSAGQPHVFAIDQSGTVTLAQAVTDDTEEEHNFVRVHYKDSADNEASVPLQVDRLASSSGGFFPSNQITLAVNEDTGASPENSIIKLEPTDLSAYTDISYTMHNAEGNDNSGPKFTIHPNTGEISVAQGLDFEQQTEFLLQVEVTATNSEGKGETHIAVVKVEVVDVNEGPTDVTLSGTSVDENSVVGTVIGSLSAVDPEGQVPVTFTVSDPSGNVGLDGADIVTLKSLDFESMTEKSFDVTVTATDGETPVDTTFTITVNNVNEAPTSISIDVLEFPESAEGELATVTAVDPEGDEYRCTLTNGNELTILQNKLRVKTQLNFEDKSEISITVQCADEPTDDSPSLLSAPQTFTVTVTDVDENPSDFTLVADDLPEDAQPGAVVGTVSATDPDANAPTFGFEVVKPKENGVEVPSKFEIKNIECTVNADTSRTCTAEVVLASGDLDYEGASEEVLQIRPKTDGVSGGDVGFGDAAALPVKVKDVNDPPLEPRWGTSGGFLIENPKTKEDRIVGVLEARDQDEGQSHTFTLKDSPLFSLEPVVDARRANSDAMQVVVNEDAEVDFESNPSMSFTIEIEDDGEPKMKQTFSMTIPVQDRPMTIALQSLTDTAVFGTMVSVEENSAGTVGEKVVLEDHDRDDWEYTVTLDSQVPSSPVFTLGADNVLESPSLDFESITSFLLSFTATVQCTASAASSCVAPEPISGNVTVSVVDVDEAPALSLVGAVKAIKDDEKVGTTLAQYTCADPDGDAVSMTLDANHNDVFHVQPVAGAPGTFALKTKNVPSTTDLMAEFSKDASTLQKSLGVTCSANGKSATHNPAVEIRNDCYNHQCSGTCIDESTLTNPVINSHRCEVSLQGINDKSTGDNNSDDKEAGGSSGIGAGAIAGIIIAMIVLAVLFVFIVMRRNQQRKPLFGDVERGMDHHHDNPAMGSQGAAFISKPADYDDPTAFHPGMSNPVYGWYQPEMSRQECTDYLMNQDDGTFVVRDSKATPGWHMLGVKNQGKVIHEKIRMNEEGSYELLPNSNKKQPKFAELPELVDYYGNPQEGVEYALAISNPMYDNKQLDEGTGYATAEQLLWRRDESAPVVPIKDKDRAIVEAVGNYNPDGEDLYTNTTQAKAALVRTPSGVNC